MLLTEGGSIAPYGVPVYKPGRQWRHMFACAALASGQMGRRVWDLTWIVAAVEVVAMAATYGIRTCAVGRQYTQYHRQ
jgi:hypothetical protein